MRTLSNCLYIDESFGDEITVCLCSGHCQKCSTEHELQVRMCLNVTVSLST